MMEDQTNSVLAAETAAEFRSRHDGKELIRFIACGSAADGKSTLIARLMYETRARFDDRLSGLDGGLLAESGQGNTIGVAYRFFATDDRKFIIADTPGHGHYTSNVVTGASNSDVALILVDARKGILPETRRHNYVLSLLGIRQIIVAVNKMDLVGYDRGAFGAISRDYAGFAEQLGVTAFAIVPLSALHGDNVTARSDTMPWYSGPSLLEALCAINAGPGWRNAPMRFPVHCVDRPNEDFLGYSGTVASGSLRRGDRVTVLPSAVTTTVARIVTMDGELDEALAGQTVTVVLAEEINANRGDMIVAAEARPDVADQIAAHVVWMGDEPLLPGRGYLLRLGSRTVSAQVTEIKYKVNVNTLEHVAAKRLELNAVGFCNLALDAHIPVDPYAQNRVTGAFVLIDRTTNATVACGIVDFPLRRALNVHWQHIEVHKAARAGIKGQKPCVLWFTGLSGSGKSTVTNLVEKKLLALGKHTYLLDGDNVRHGLNKDLGFTAEDRVENIRRIGECAKLFVDAGLIVLTAFISPFRSERRMARELLAEGEFLEVFVDVPLEVCEDRDPKGLYKKARAGKLPNFTGIDSPYEPPEAPEIHLDAATHAAEVCATYIIDDLIRQGYI